MTAAALPRHAYDGSAVDELLQSVERFCRAEIDAGAIDAAAKVPQRVLDGLAELGLFGITLPEAYGGAGLPLLDACQVVAQIARHDRSVATTLGLHLGLGTRALVAYGSEGLKARYLPQLASGEAIAAFATTEPNAGSDLSALSTRGIAHGSQLVVNGSKVYVTNGGIAGVYTLTVFTPGLAGAQRGSSLIVFEPGQAGLTVGREEKKLGLKGSSTTGLTLEDVRVDLERVIGTPGHGAEHLAHVLAWGRTLLSAGCCGTARTAFERAREHTAYRRQFGKTLDAQPVVREQLATMVARIEAMESLVQQTARLQQDVPALALRSLATKVFCSEGAMGVVDTALQLHGGSGFIEETGLPLLWRDVRVTRIFEGANDVLLSRLGAAFVVEGRKRARHTSRATPSTRALGERADALALRIEAAKDALSARHRVGLLQKSRSLHRLGRAVMWSEALDAAFESTAPSIASLEIITEVAEHECAWALSPSVDDHVLTQALEHAGAQS